MAAFNNRGNAPQGERFAWSPGWTLMGQDTAQWNIDQPVLFDYRVVSRRGVADAGGYPIDDCAAIVARS